MDSMTKRGKPIWTVDKRDSTGRRYLFGWHGYRFGRCWLVTVHVGRHYREGIPFWPRRIRGYLGARIFAWLGLWIAVEDHPYVAELFRGKK